MYLTLNNQVITFQPLLGFQENPYKKDECRLPIQLYISTQAFRLLIHQVVSLVFHWVW